MDDNRGQRRQNEPPRHPSSNRRHHQLLPHGDQFWPAPLSTPSTRTVRGMDDGSASYSTYYQESAARGFPTTAGTYNPTAMMYDVPQATGPQSTAGHDTSQQFSSRQPAGMQMMAMDATALYSSSEAASTAGPTALQAQASRPSGASQPNLQSYSSGSIGSIGGMAAESSQAQEVRMDEKDPAPGGLDTAYASYQSALKAVFQNIQEGSLASASKSLLTVSDWLLSHVAELGLTSDDQNLHSDRIKLWIDFNHAWLGILQAQKDMMESGQQLQPPRSLIPQDGLEKMANELVRLCDSIQRHGLVDYDYGVWEEQIIAVLGECVDLYGGASHEG